MKTISIIIPCYNEESNLHSLYEALTSFINSQPNYQWQILMVNDGSKAFYVSTQETYLLSSYKFVTFFIYTFVRYIEI